MPATKDLRVCMGIREHKDFRDSLERRDYLEMAEFLELLV
jgi:hypothetical protein